MKSSREGKDLMELAERALRRAARVARETARSHGTPVYVIKNGRIVALKPQARFARTRRQSS